MPRLLTYSIALLLSFQTAFAQLPERILPPRPLSECPDTVSIAFMGDVMMHQGQIENALQGDGKYSFKSYFREISGIVEGADLAVANMEFTLAGRPYTGYPCFSAPDEYAAWAAGSGIDLFLTANNHILDRGKSGIERTLMIYDEMGRSSHVRYTGCALDHVSDSLKNPLVLAVKGVRIAFVNFTYGTNQDIASEYPVVHRSDTSWIGGAIRRAKAAGVDFVIALPHWGNEYVLSHSESQHRLAVWMAEQGCDAIIGAHPHVVQDMETITVEDEAGSRDVQVAYSLGNIISNMSAPNTRIGMIVTVRIVTDKDGRRSMLPWQLTMTWCTRPGTLTESYCTIPVKDYLDRRDLWIAPYDHDNMAENYERVKNITKIKD